MDFRTSAVRSLMERTWKFDGCSNIYNHIILVNIPREKKFMIKFRLFGFGKLQMIKNAQVDHDVKFSEPI